MRVLVVVAHPNPASYCHALAAAAERGLIGAGHQVDIIDLEADDFRAEMSLEERRAYHSGEPVVDTVVARHVELVRAAEALVFVYPTWWSGLPAVLKGWLDRVLVEGVAFVFDERSHRVRPGLRRVRHIVGVSTYGSSRRYVRLINDNGRRMLHRSLVLSTGWRTKRTWLALYSLDTLTEADRDAFLQRVERTLGALT
jgi:NAD(P)H dehydrogenase (quinone)